MRLISWPALLLCVGPLLFLLWCALSPPLYSYHPFHPNHAHLPSSYIATHDWLSRYSPSALLSSAIVPSSYIEGWYLKLRTAEGRHLALIYMYFVSSDAANSTAAITLLDAHNERSHLFQYPLEQFKSSPLPSARQSLPSLLSASPDSPHSSSPFHDFELRIGNATMSPYAVTASLRSAGQSEAWVSAEVDLTLERTVAASALLPERYAAYPWSTVFSPASHTVGLFAFLPLACYQQVIELQLAVNGHVTLDGERIDLDGGTAYYEKTRGSTFPDNYLWIHASHFAHTQSDTDGAAVGTGGGAGEAAGPLLSSFFFSLASVPILPTSLRLPGFVCAFVLDGRASHFATQLGSVLTSLSIDERHVSFVLYDQQFTTRVAVAVTRSPAPISEDSWLWAARNGRLRRVIPQRIGSDTAHVSVQRVTAPAEQHAPSNGSDRTGMDADALSFSSRGYSFSRVASASSGSVGLEVFVHEGELQRQVGVMYEEVRPWLRERYFPIDTPLVSFSLSDTFLRSVLPDAVGGVVQRLGVRLIILVLALSVLAVGAAIVSALLLSARRSGPKLKAE